jgi:hypothetical protein
LPALYWLTDKVGGPRVQVGYNMETNLRNVTTNPVIFGLIGDAADVFCLVVYSKLPEQIG